MKRIFMIGAVLVLFSGCSELNKENTGSVKDVKCQKVLGNWVGPGVRVRIYHKDEKFYLEHDGKVAGWGLCGDGNISIPLSPVAYLESQDAVTIENRTFVRVQ